MSTIALLESLSLRDNPENVEISFSPSIFLSKIDCLITNKRQLPINLSLIGTILRPKNENHNRLIVCSVLNNLYPESIIIKQDESLVVPLATMILDNKHSLPNSEIQYFIDKTIEPKLISLIQRHLTARRKVIRSRFKEVQFKHGEKSYFKLTHLYDSIQKHMKGA